MDTPVTTQLATLPGSQVEAAISELQRKTPTSEFGYPLGFYRSDLLPWHDYLREVDLGALFPTANGGDPDERQEGQSKEVRQVEEAVEPVLADFTVDLDLDLDEYEAGIEPDIDELLAPPPTRLPAHPSASLPPVSDRIAGFRRRDLIPAFVPLSFDEGFPSLPDGRPCWDRLEWESPEAFQAFSAYIEMPDANEGIRALGDLPEVMAVNKLITYETYDQNAYTQQFRSWFIQYYWNTRTKAHDIFKMAAFRKQQEFRAINVQNSHYGIAASLKVRLMEYFGSDEDFWEMMTPKVGIELLKMLVGMERLAVGLPANAPLTEGKGVGVGGQSMEMILRTLTQQLNPSSALGVTVGDEARDSGVKLASQILSDPKSTQIAQELIIRLTQQPRTPQS